MDEVRRHSTADDAWMVLSGRVYNITPYMPFHPGGAEILAAAAGKDGTALFQRYHPWVNGHALLEACLLGAVKARARGGCPGDGVCGGRGQERRRRGGRAAAAGGPGAGGARAAMAPGWGGALPWGAGGGGAASVAGRSRGGAVPRIASGARAGLIWILDAVFRMPTQPPPRLRRATREGAAPSGPAAAAAAARRRAAAPHRLAAARRRAAALHPLAAARRRAAAPHSLAAAQRLAALSPAPAPPPLLEQSGRVCGRHRWWARSD
jgi:hypothetical protein